jgi:hypothetical protein
MTDFTKDLTRGVQAAELLENPILKEAFLTIEQEIINLWQESRSNQTELREEAYLTLWGMRKFKKYLETVITGGKIAQAELQRLNQKESS